MVWELTSIPAMFAFGLLFNEIRNAAKVSCCLEVHLNVLQEVGKNKFSYLRWTKSTASEFIKYQAFTIYHIEMRVYGTIDTYFLNKLKIRALKDFLKI